MSSAYLELDERHAVLVAVVVKGAAHVAGRIDHIELLRHRRQQRALHHNARQGNHKHQVKQVVATGNAGYHGKETKDDRSRAAQARPAYERDLARVCLKGRQEHADGDGTAHEEHKRHERQARQQHLRQACGRYEQAEQEEDRHLSHLGEGVKEVRHLDFAGDVAGTQHNACQVYSQKAVAAQIAW